MRAKTVTRQKVQRFTGVVVYVKKFEGVEAVDEQAAFEAIEALIDGDPMMDKRTLCNWYALPERA